MGGGGGVPHGLVGAFVGEECVSNAQVIPLLVAKDTSLSPLSLVSVPIRAGLPLPAQSHLLPH